MSSSFRDFVLLFTLLSSAACGGDASAPSADTSVAWDHVPAGWGGTSARLNCPRDHLGYTRLDVGEVSLNVACRGEGRAIVFLHGYPCFHMSWQKYVEPLVQRGFRVVLPDLRGFNLSDKPRAIEAYQLERLSEDVDGVIAATGDSQVLLVGYDWGGVLGWVYGHRHPEKLRGLMLMAAPHPDTWYRPEVDPVQAQAAEAYVPLFAGPLGELMFVFFDLYIGPHVSPAELQQYHEAWDRPRAKVSMNNWYRANVYPERRLPSGVTIDVKTLSVWGDRDELVTASQIQHIAPFVRDHRVVRLDADHWFPLSMPERVTEELVKFEQTLAP